MENKIKRWIFKKLEIKYTALMIQKENLEKRLELKLK